MQTQKILTIAIPTYNRAPFLQQNIASLLPQIKGIEDKIELLISDNCSTDNTKQVVEEFIAQGAPITYSCNEDNLGMDGNFVACFKKATSKYVWLLGDDDILLDGILLHIISLIEGNDYGLIHLTTSNYSDNCDVLTNKADFMNNVSYWITFISSNIVQTKYVQQIDFDKYMGTYFTLIPVYLSAVADKKENLYIRFQTMNGGLDCQRNGGYNIYQVFITNYLAVIKEFCAVIGKSWYRNQKKIILLKFLWGFTVNIFITKKIPHNFTHDKWKSIIFKQYWYNWCFYYFVAKLTARKVVNVLINR